VTKDDLVEKALRSLLDYGAATHALGALQMAKVATDNAGIKLAIYKKAEEKLTAQGNEASNELARLLRTHVGSVE
jgi:hypothetical protein